MEHFSRLVLLMHRDSKNQVLRSLQNTILICCG